MSTITSNAKANAGSIGRVSYFFQSRKILQNWQLYLMLLPAIMFYVVFHYAPMYGAQLAFKDFNAMVGIWGSPLTSSYGFGHFIRWFQSPFFIRLVTNTLLLNLYTLIFGFPLPILLALMINELKNKRLGKVVSNITYIPFFLSAAVIVGMVRNFVHVDYGIVNMIIIALGGESINFFREAEWFRFLFVSSGIWQTTGWNSIIFIAALAGVDPELHESAKIDGANRFHRLIYVNLPSIAPTIIILFILNMGTIMTVGFERAFLFQHDLNLSRSDVISTYVYRIGIQGAQFSFSSAIGLFNSIINCTILVIANSISRKVSDTSLW